MQLQVFDFYEELARYAVYADGFLLIIAAVGVFVFVFRYLVRRNRHWGERSR